MSQVGDECAVATAVGHPEGRNRFLVLLQERRVAMLESCHDRHATEWELKLLVNVMCALSGWIGAVGEVAEAGQ